MYTYFLFAHIAGVLGFAASHGASIMVAGALRRERNPDRLRALLDLSLEASGWSYYALLLLAGSGIGLGFIGGYWASRWLWLSIAILVGTSLLMTIVSVKYYDALREALGLKPHRRSCQAAGPLPFDEARFSQLSAKAYPLLLKLVGFSAFAAILWMMIAKPA